MSQSASDAKQAIDAKLSQEATQASKASRITLETFILNAIKSGSPVLKNAFKKEALFRNRTQMEALALLMVIQQCSKDLDLEKTYKSVLEHAKAELEVISQLNKKIQEKIKEFEGDLTWSLRTNKMELVLKGAIAFLEKHFYDVCDGIIPEDYRFLSHTPTVLGNQQGAKGNSRETFLKAALILILHKLDISRSSLDIKGNESALCHLTPLPAKLKLEEIPGSEKSSFIFNNLKFLESERELPEKEFMFVHSGYAFGGHRFEKRYPNGREFGPEDCSSGIASFLNCKAPVSTNDMLFSYRHKTKDGGFIEKDWTNGKECASLQDLWDPVIVKDPTKDIKPGDVYCVRRFADTDPELNKTQGVSGHTAMVVGVQSNGAMTTLGYNRDMPAKEGFGLEDFPYRDAANKKVMIFRARI